MVILWESGIEHDVGKKANGHSPAQSGDINAMWDPVDHDVIKTQKL